VQSKLRDAEAQLAPLQRRILSLEADKESAAQELAAVKEHQVGAPCAFKDLLSVLGNRHL
jgi:hypothetical protein